MKNHLIPGHFRAFTFWACLILGFITYWTTNSPVSVLGIELLLLGLFLGDQATHLSQEDHSALPPTKIEKLMQNYKFPFVIIGLILSSIGLFLIF
jgi:hypothetical protein